jgi:exodeoxyribonuclease V beta subunit
VRRESWTYDVIREEPRAASSSEPLRALAVERAMASWRHTSSFSRLVKHEQGALAVFDEEESRDHDQIPLTSAIGGTGAIQLAEPPIPITLSDFPRGARTGNLFHEILEEIDFAAGDQQLESITAAKLRSYGIAGSSAELEHWRTQAVTALRESLATPLLPEKFALRDVKSANKLAELEFRMPVGSKDFSLTRQRLANVFRVHTSKAIPESYPRHIEQLAFRDLSGFLVGFVDLVFEHEGRWYVVDYKTNHLGDTIADYDTRAMTRALVESHYYLQYHIYTVALHRYLKHFLKGYDYGQHFGGVFYLFIKGMHPKAPPGSGVYFEKPPLGRIEALSALLAGTEAESRISA